MRLKHFFIFYFSIIVFNSCAIFSSTTKEKRYVIFKDMSILLYSDNKFELLNKLTENTKGRYTIIGDTIYLKSEYRRDSIEILDLEFKNVENVSKDSIYIKYSVKDKTGTYLSFLEFYNEDTSSFKYFHPPFDRKIENNTFTKFRVRFGDGSSPYIHLPNFTFNYISFKISYPSRPDWYIFMNNDKFLIKGNKLIKIDSLAIPETKANK
ncbi:MAG: hypothetical protein WC994_07925 [Brumimicrobium sp.]